MSPCSLFFYCFFLEITQRALSLIFQNIKACPPPIPLFFGVPTDFLIFHSVLPQTYLGPSPSQLLKHADLSSLSKMKESFLVCSYFCPPSILQLESPWCVPSPFEATPEEKKDTSPSRKTALFGLLFHYKKPGEVIPPSLPIVN